MPIRLPTVILACAAACAARADDTPSSPAPAAGVPEASIAFAHSSIWNWQVIDDQTVLIETNSHQWYRARLMSPCFDLPFVEQVGFESNADGSFDKFSTIRARGQTCPVTSLTKTDPPPKKKASPKKHADPAKPPG